MAAASSIDEFVESHSDAELLPSGKVRCTVTGHEVLPQIELLKAHWDGKKYRTRKAQSKYDFSAHEPWLVPHKKDPNLLFCVLTKQPVSRQPRAVEGHINGKRFKRLLQEETASKSRKADPAHSKGEDGDDDEWEDMDDDEGEEGEEGEEDGEHMADSDEDDDAKEFLQEGAFWEHGGDADEDEEDEEGEEGEEGGLGVTQARAKAAGSATAVVDDDDDEDETFWVRGASGAQQQSGKRDRAGCKKSGAGSSTSSTERKKSSAESKKSSARSSKSSSRPLDLGRGPKLKAKGSRKAGSTPAASNKKPKFA